MKKNVTKKMKTKMKKTRVIRGGLTKMPLANPMPTITTMPTMPAMPAVTDIISDRIEAKHPGIIGPASAYATELGNNLASRIPFTDNIKSTLNGILQTLKDPEMRQNIRNIVGEGATTLAIGLEASQPAIDKVFSSIVDAIEKSTEKIANASISVFMNTAEEVPGIGIFIGTIRSLDTIVKTIQSLVNAGSEVIIANADAVSEITERIQQIKSQLLNKVNALSTKADNLSQMTGAIPDNLAGNFANNLAGNLTNKLNTAQGNMMSSLNSKIESKMPSFPMPPTASMPLQQAAHAAQVAGGGLSINNISKQLYLKKKILKQLGGSISEFHDSTLHPRRLVKTFKRKHRR